MTDLLAGEDANSLPEQMSNTTALEQSKRFVLRHFERLLVLFLVASMVAIHFFIDHKLAFLSFYYLPIIAAGFLVGRKMAVWAAVFVVCLVCFVQKMQGLEGPAGLRVEDATMERAEQQGDADLRPSIRLA